MFKFRKVAVTGAILAASLGLAACSSENNNSQGGSKVTQSSKKKNTIKYYKKGETVKVDNVEYTLKSVKTTSYRNEFADEKPKNVIKVTYHVKNDGKKDIPIGTDLNVYGPDNTKLKTYPIDDTTLDSVAAGKEADVVEGFGTKKLGNFELQFKPLVSVKSAAKYKATVNQ